MFPRFRRFSARLGPWPAAWLALSLASANAGCSRFTHTKQCRRLIAQVNPALDEVLSYTASDVDGGTGGTGGGGSKATRSGASTSGAGGSPSVASGSARFIAAAARYERLAKELLPMEFSSEQMAKNVAEYAGVLTSTAQTLRELAAALDANNSIEADRASHEIERLNLRERSVVARMDAWCQAD